MNHQNRFFIVVHIEKPAVVEQQAFIYLSIIKLFLFSFSP